MFIIAWMYNTNGMASWCWEAAQALHEAGQPVTLVCGPAVHLPEDTPFPSITYNLRPGPPGIGPKIKGDLNRLLPQSTGFVWELHLHLAELGITPTAYLLNQSNAQDPRVPVPQYVTGWAYPTSFRGYAAKVGIYTGWRFPDRRLSFDKVQMALTTIGWWGKDWRAYRSATGVLAVSRRLHRDLAAKGIHSFVVHPGTALSPRVPVIADRKPARLLTVALDLEDPRKRVRWLLEALNKMPDKSQLALTLVGNAGLEFQSWAHDQGFPVTFTGQLSRDDVQMVMADHDIFLFASALDDWGYVLVEAMSNNLCVAAPNLSPFDEIVGDTGALYLSHSQEDLGCKVAALLSGDIPALRQAARRRAETLFSRAAFAQSLLAAIGASAPSEESNPIPSRSRRPTARPDRISPGLSESRQESDGAGDGACAR